MGQRYKRGHGVSEELPWHTASGVAACGDSSPLLPAVGWKLSPILYNAHLQEKGGVYVLPIFLFQFSNFQTQPCSRSRFRL